MTNEEIQNALKTLSGWGIRDIDGVAQLHKRYSFKNFAEALAFTNHVGALAEEHDHHPELVTAWGEVTVTWWTHTAKGLTENDFRMAAAVDAL